MKTTPDKIEAQITTISQHSGPLPPAEELAKYDKIVPGAAERILHMAENEQAHRHKETSRQIKNAIATTYLAIWLAFIVVLILAGVMVYAIYKSVVSEWIGGAFAAIASVIGVFMCVRLIKSTYRKD